MTPTIGRIVHYRMSNGYWRPAIVTQVWSDQCVNLQVFTDYYNDPFGADGKPQQLVWATSVMQGEENGQWRWPPRE